MFKKKKSLKPVFLIFTLIASSALLTGCESLFEEQRNKYELVPEKNDKLEEDTYYVKSGTDLYPVYAAAGTAMGTALKIEPNRVLWLMEDESLVPTLYKGEVIAYASQNELEGTSLERFKDSGYSIGTYQMEWDEENEEFDYELSTVIEDSSCYKVFSEDKSEKFSIKEINGQKVSKDMANSAGVFTCLEKDADYEVSYYSGTYFEKAVFTAGTHMFQAYELFSLDDVEATKNGYLEIHLPEDLKSGWYMIGGKGIFKYVAHERDSSKEPFGDEWNDPYFTNEIDSYSYAQKYSVSFDTTTRDATINVTIDPNSIGDDGISVQAQSPDGTIYDLTNEKVSNTYKGKYETENGTVYSVTLDEAVPGKWLVYISPKTIEVAEVTVASAEFDEEKTEVSEEFELLEDATNKEFKVTFSGDGDINGVVVAPDGQTYVLQKKDTVSKTYYYNMPYLKAGIYVVKAYHNTDTKIEEIKMEDMKTDAEEDIITVTG
jgi:hypothetical protein